jgi:serine/threonine protein kinase
VVAEDSSAELGGLPAGLVPGSRLAGYVLEGLVGAGGMAAVYRARDERLGRVVALKLLAAELTKDDGFRRRFLREARAVAAVDHPHIIPVYQAGEADGVLFIAMRFVRGGDLREMVSREGGLPPLRAASFISPVASALDAAHAMGLVHRDIKPANILVDAGPGRPEHVYLSDFGLARGVLSSSGLTRAGQFLGTPDYAAPEQIAGRTVDGRADQYALACVAYTLLACAVVFIRDHPMASLYAHLHEPPPRLTEARPDLPRAVDRVMARALAKEPDDRYPSCGAFADALREALGVGPYGTAELSRPSTGMLPSVPVRQPTVAVGDPSRELQSTMPDGGTAGMTMATSLPSAPGSPAQQSPGRPSAAAGAASPGVASPGVAASAPVPPARPGSSRGVATWTAVVTADRGYYDRVRAQGVLDQDQSSKVHFPDHYPERRFPLSGNEASIGRLSRSRHTHPDIDLTGPHTDWGLSRDHARLIAGPDGTWSVVDSGTNGTLVNGTEIPPGVPVPLRDGDRINLGAWTRITMTRG